MAAAAAASAAEKNDFFSLSSSSSSSSSCLSLASTPTTRNTQCAFFTSQVKRRRWQSFAPTTTTTTTNDEQTWMPQSTSLLIFPLLILALTGVVCTHKIQAEEECLSSNVICYECDSKNDPNCADPFDFSPDATLTLPDFNDNHNVGLYNLPTTTTNNSSRQQTISNNNNNNNTTQPIDLTIISSTIPTNSSPPAIRIPKKLPATTICHGCCVKLTSKLPDGSNYVKRTCTTNLQINYFMVGLVCMKESGDRGKMCFCETDYCNGAQASLNHNPIQSLVIASIALLVTTFLLKI